MKKKTLLLMLAVLFMFTAVWADNAEAVSGTSSSGEGLQTHQEKALPKQPGGFGS
ncbi:hypothetical protein QKW52_04295 [Bacillus sonorensis]|nr:hypothetical protein [Bacillus sonorensis]